MTDLGHGRGWAAPDAAASIFRIDAQLGRPVQITEAGRSAEDADRNHAAWIRYQNGGPWAPYALPASESVHCLGEATDSYDDAAPWTANGWRQTARYNDDRDEPWHREYDQSRDQHRTDPATTQEETDMQIIAIIGKAGARRGGAYQLIHTGGGRGIAVYLGTVEGVPVVSDESAITALQGRFVGLA